LIAELLAILPLAETDMTIFFRRLARLKVNDPSVAAAGDDALMAPLDGRLLRARAVDVRTAQPDRQLAETLSETGRPGQHPHETRRRRMNAVNPKYVLRNYMAQLAIDKAEQGDFALIHELLELLRHPYDEQPEKEAFAAKRPDWARHRPAVRCCRAVHERNIRSST
jgi:uncharacterized protein YdiU (UPF0061 family)